jgi:TusA-related sulfurtransferase
MTTPVPVTDTLDARGEVCPIPLAKTKQRIDAVPEDEVLEVLSTEANSVPDFESWASMTDGVELVEQVEEDEDGRTVYKHYVKRTG